MTRQERRLMEKQNSKRPNRLAPIPDSMWPKDGINTRFAVWHSRYYLVQGFHEQNEIVRISVNRTNMRPDGRWDDRIEWDELQDIKRQVGFGSSFAVEIYPRDGDVVNVANMRHLWILPKPMDFGWFNMGYNA